ncbi:Ig domain-containing protein [Pedosphaera parvula]|uniref:Ig family protein n=1 Tax=Pedosphaera parvula (strain Ellin514) TaxID=320771 RepID=B9XEQ4_PEDPL|nr:Ig domain-containing protein [Pedosphaera parvula]EEF61768.1 Ig family protein [Pedosphaera parvula Ellin514]
MKKLLTPLIGNKIFLLSLLLFVSTRPVQAGDVNSYLVLKGQSFFQSDAGSAAASGATIQAQVSPNGFNFVTNAALLPPGGTWVVLPAKSDGFTLKQNFASVVALDAAYPNGTYAVATAGVNDGMKTNYLSLTGNLYPTTPHFSNFNAAQAVDPTLDFTLTWDAIAGATANDFLQIQIRDCTGNKVIASPEFGKSGGLNGLATAFTIPAQTLRSGMTYTAEMQVVRISTFDNTSYPGASGVAAYLDDLQMNLITTGTQVGCAQGQFQLVFNFASGSFGSGTTGTISFPQAISYYFALYNVDNDTNYPSTVTFTGPSSSGLNNTTNSNVGSDFGTSAFYSSPPINTPPFPGGGIYTVVYKGMSNNFNLPNPDAVNEQVLIVPSVAIDASNVVQQIYWTYKSSSGATIAAPAFMGNIEIRVEGFNGRLYDAGNEQNRIAPSVTNHFPTQTIIWTNVTSIGMVFNDLVGNSYDSYWNRTLQPLAITTTNLPIATQGSFYSFLLSASGGNQQYNWSVVSNSLPGGLTLNGITGEISGTPSTSGNFNFIAQVQDTSGSFTNRVLSLLVNAGNTPAITLSSPTVANGQFRFQVNGHSGVNYTIQVSTNLINWAALLTTNSTSTSFKVLDAGVGGFSRRYYRVQTGP